MDRRNFIKGTTAAALAAAPVGAAANAAQATDDASTLAAPTILPQRHTLRMVSLWSDAVFGPADHIHRFAKRIEAATDGRWVIEIDTTPVTGTDAFSSVMRGDADIYAGHEHAQRQLNPAFSYFAGLPCGTGMDIDHLNAWLMSAGGQELWDELAAEFDMKGLVIGHSEAAHGLFTRQPIRTRADFHGKRIAVTGLAAEVLEAIDATPVDGTNVSLTAMSKDASLDGIEPHGPAIAITGKQFANLKSIMPHRLLPGLSDTGHAITFGMRRSLWDSLPTSERIMLSALASEAFAASRAETLAQVRALDQITDAAIDTTTPSRPAHWDLVTGELSRIATTIVAQMSGHDSHSARINASYMAFKGHPHVPANA